jgi:hypothetical protein
MKLYSQLRIKHVIPKKYIKREKLKKPYKTRKQNNKLNKPSINKLRSYKKINHLYNSQSTPFESIV